MVWLGGGMSGARSSSEPPEPLQQQQQFNNKTGLRFVYILLAFRFPYRLYKVGRGFCLKLKISITTELIGFYILGKLHIGSLVLSYFIFRYKSWNGLKLFF